MTKVFIGGSRQIKRLPSSVLVRIGKIITRGFTVLIGDANGADKAVQRYLFEQKYQSVVVYCSASSCRNNLGKWPVNNVRVPVSAKGFDFYAAKDLAMAKDADYGLMLWDGISNGTINNILNLLDERKKTAVYLVPQDTFFTIKETEDLNDLLSHCDDQVLKKIEAKIGLSRRIAA